MLQYWISRKQHAFMPCVDDFVNEQVDVSQGHDIRKRHIAKYRKSFFYRRGKRFPREKLEPHEPSKMTTGAD